MTETTGPKKSVTLDDLLKANQQQFDKVFGIQRTEMGLLRGSRAAVTRAELTSASLERARGLGTPGTIEAPKAGKCCRSMESFLPIYRTKRCKSMVSEK